MKLQNNFIGKKVLLHRRKQQTKQQQQKEEKRILECLIFFSKKKTISQPVWVIGSNACDTLLSYLVYYFFLFYNKKSF